MGARNRVIAESEIDLEGINSEYKLKGNVKQTGEGFGEGNGAQGNGGKQAVGK